MIELTTEGLVVQTFDEIRTELGDALRAEFGESIDLSDSSVLGQLVAILAEREATLHEILQAITASLDPDGATGSLLDAICALTGTRRDAAEPSTVTITCTGSPTTVIPSGSQVSVASTGKIFETTANGTIALLTSWASSTAYSVGAKRTNAGRCYVCTVAGTSAGSGGPTTTASSITDNTVTWRYLGEGTGAVDIAAVSEEEDAIVAVAHDITEIETPVAGWESVINLLDATLGNLVESDESLRAKREDEIAAAGSGTVNAIRAAILQVEGVTACTVFQNPTDSTDSDGVPPHSIECLVQGGDDQDIWDTIFDNVSAGIGVHGDETGTVTDDGGNSWDMAFTRPTEITIYVAITIIKDPDEYPEDGDDQVKAAIVAWGDAQKAGKNAVSSAIAAQAFTVPGVLEVTTCYIKTSPGPTLPTTIAVSTREIATYDTSRISVTTSDGTP